MLSGMSSWKAFSTPSCYLLLYHRHDLLLLFILDQSNKPQVGLVHLPPTKPPFHLLCTAQIDRLNDGFDRTSPHNWQGNDWARMLNCDLSPFLVNNGVFLHQPRHPQDAFLWQIGKYPGDDLSFITPTIHGELDIPYSPYFSPICQRENLEVPIWCNLQF